MSKKQGSKANADKTVRNIQRQTRRKFNAEEKIRIVLAGLRGEESIAELCRQEGIHQNLYYNWSREFLEAGKKRLAGRSRYDAYARQTVPSNDTRQDRTLAPFTEKPHPAGALLPTRRFGAADCRIYQPLQHTEVS